MIRKTLLALALLAGPAAAQDIGGRYAVEGTGFDGQTYRGEAVISAASDVTCEIAWNTGGQLSQGICMRQGNIFAAAYAIEGAVGMVIYEVAPDGSMRGTWTIQGSDGVGAETLTPLPG
jgi:hypothetical protein